jgi:hypothetical protein
MNYKKEMPDGMIFLAENIVYDQELNEFIVTIGNVSIVLDFEEFSYLSSEVLNASKKIKSILLQSVRPSKIDQEIN